jgi:hypothetical protein
MRLALSVLLSMLFLACGQITDEVISTADTTSREFSAEIISVADVDSLLVAHNMVNDLSAIQLITSDEEALYLLSHKADSPLGCRSIPIERPDKTAGKSLSWKIKTGFFNTLKGATRIGNKPYLLTVMGKENADAEYLFCRLYKTDTAYSRCDTMQMSFNSNNEFAVRYLTMNPTTAAALSGGQLTDLRALTFSREDRLLLAYKGHDTRGRSLLVFAAPHIFVGDTVLECNPSSSPAYVWRPDSIASMNAELTDVAYDFIETGYIFCFRTKMQSPFFQEFLCLN